MLLRQQQRQHAADGQQKRAWRSAEDGNLSFGLLHPIPLESDAKDAVAGMDENTEAHTKIKGSKDNVIYLCMCGFKILYCLNYLIA